MSRGCQQTNQIKCMCWECYSLGALILAEFDPGGNVAQHQPQALVVQVRDASHGGGKLGALARLQACGNEVQVRVP